MWISTESVLIFTSLQRRVSAGLNLLSEGDRISPSLKDPKNAVTQAVHTTLILSFGQSDLASWCPSIFRIGRDIAFLDSFEISL